MYIGLLTAFVNPGTYSNTIFLSFRTDVSPVEPLESPSSPDNFRFKIGRPKKSFGITSAVPAGVTLTFFLLIGDENASGDNGVALSTDPDSLTFANLFLT